VELATLINPVLEDRLIREREGVAPHVELPARASQDQKKNQTKSDGRNAHAAATLRADCASPATHFFVSKVSAALASGIDFQNRRVRDS
jgi:hypothetical protein